MSFACIRLQGIESIAKLFLGATAMLFEVFP